MVAWFYTLRLLALPLLILAICCVVAAQAPRAEGESAWDHVPVHDDEGMDHSDMITDPFTSAHEVTETCLMCHPDVADSFMMTSHWTWINDEVILPGDTEPVPYGKINSINNFCVAVPSNWGRCTQCHAGYGWTDMAFDFTDPNNIDCLVCHDLSGTYTKALKTGGYPDENVDLLVSAQSVGRPNRANCGACHFNGGGGNGVKHGDLDMTLIDAPDEIDIHMGVHDFTCQDCHVTEEHAISGRLPWLTSDTTNSFGCRKCHGEAPHRVTRINTHCATVACQACHIPAFAPEQETVMHWDWSTAGLEEAPDDRHWSRKKGSFVMETDVVPEYYWWNGEMDYYLPGQESDATQPLELTLPRGGITDMSARIWPFKVHRGLQPFDAQLNHILVPKLFGQDGFWSTWDWHTSLELGAAVSGIDYSGEYLFAETEMYWPVTHMVRAKSAALKCMDCHGEDGRMPWTELGYSGDPMLEGGR